MKIYIAGAWVEQHERARPMMAAVRALGHEITVDWTGDAEANAKILGVDGLPITSDAQLPRDERIVRARGNLTGIIKADLLWLLAPDVKACGNWVELGMALMRRDWGLDDRITVIVSGPKRGRTVFTELADHLFETDAAALEWLKSQP
jgi:hypothetical protein